MSTSKLLPPPSLDITREENKNKTSAERRRNTIIIRGSTLGVMETRRKKSRWEKMTTFHGVWPCYVCCTFRAKKENKYSTNICFPLYKKEEEKNKINKGVCVATWRDWHTHTGETGNVDIDGNGQVIASNIGAEEQEYQIQPLGNWCGSFPPLNSMISNESNKMSLQKKIKK